MLLDSRENSARSRTGRPEGTHGAGQQEWLTALASQLRELAVKWVSRKGLGHLLGRKSPLTAVVNGQEEAMPTTQGFQAQRKAVTHAPQTLIQLIQLGNVAVPVDRYIQMTYGGRWPPRPYMDLKNWPVVMSRGAVLARSQLYIPPTLGVARAPTREQAVVSADDPARDSKRERSDDDVDTRLVALRQQQQ